MSTPRRYLDPRVLQRLLAELDIPMDEHPAMIEAVDWYAEWSFRRLVERDPEVRAEWEAFLMSAPAPLGPLTGDVEDGSGFDF
ncbi:MAG: hypothetical protein HKL87_05145 [Acidimicrobiaceae bacterium]|nr:hypothetical protein [Acidimicrobiaceae bacterium]